MINEEEQKEPQTGKATHEEICNDALEHYERVSSEAHDWYNVVPKAIEFYKKHGGEQNRTSTPTAAAERKCKKLTVAFDFDGVLARYSGWKGHTHYGPALLGMRELLRSLQSKGHEIIIYTTRGNSEIAEWCRGYEVPYDYINRNPHIQGNNPGKPIADVYVDDRAITFDHINLGTLEEQIESFTPWWHRLKDEDWLGIVGYSDMCYKLEQEDGEREKLHDKQEKV